MKSDRFKQPTPQMQLTAIRAALEGNLSNWCDGVIGDDDFADRISMHLTDLTNLEPHLTKSEWAPD